MDVFVPFLGDFLSICTITPTIGFYKGVFVPFLGDFLSIRHAKTVRRHNGVAFSSPFLGTFFQSSQMSASSSRFLVFVPFLGDFLSINFIVCACTQRRMVFVPFLGDFLSIACLRSPSPSALASAFAAGMGGSLHQVLSFGDEMPIFPVRTGIGGDLQ